MNYGTLPKEIGSIQNGLEEMMFYQYLPVKNVGQLYFSIPTQLNNNFINEFLTIVKNDFILFKGLKEYREHYMYLTVKQLYVANGKDVNRAGIHSDGFMTEDINYIWSNEMPTIFYKGDFDNVPLNDIDSIKYFEEQKQYCEKITYPKNTILRLDQYNIHETNTDEDFEGLRCFIKVSFSKDKYDLKGNAKNDVITHNWTYRDRTEHRNIPQKLDVENNI